MGVVGVPAAVVVAVGMPAELGVAVEAARGGACAHACVELAQAWEVERLGRRCRRRLPEAGRRDARGAGEGAAARGRCRICPAGWEHDVPGAVHGTVHGASRADLGRFRLSASSKGVHRIAGGMPQRARKPATGQTRAVLSADDVRHVVHVLGWVASRQLLPAAVEETVREVVQGPRTVGACQLHPAHCEEGARVAVEGPHGMGRWHEGPISMASPVCWQWDVGWCQQMVAVVARCDEVARETRHPDVSGGICRERAEERAAGWREPAVCGPETSGSVRCRHHHHRPACDGDDEGTGVLDGTWWDALGGVHGDRLWNRKANGEESS